jgi:antitoxin StbD
METIFARKAVSVTELKRNLASVLSQAEREAIAILSHNKPAAYLLSAKHYERLLELLEDVEDAKKIRERAKGPFVEVELNEL